MKIRNIILILIFLAVGILNSDVICRQYGELEIENNLSVKKEDFPDIKT